MSDESMMIMPSAELKALMKVLMSQQISEPIEVILSDDAAGYLRTKTFLEAFGCTGWVRDKILYNRSRAAMQRALRGQDLYLRLQMLEKGAPDEQEFYVVGKPKAEEGASPPLRGGDAPVESEKPAENVPEKRGPGRPRKHPNP